MTQNFSLSNQKVLERDENSLFDHELFKETLGFLQSCFEDENRLHYINLAKKIEELAFYNNDNGILLSVQAHLWGGVFPLVQFKYKNADQNLIDQLKTGNQIAALAYTDSKKTPVSFRQTPTGFILNGEKALITNAIVAHYFTVYAKDEKGGLSCFLCKETDPGLSVTKNNLMGMRTAANGDIQFKDCHIPSERLIGPQGAAYIVFNSSIEKERLFVAAMISGRLKWIEQQLKTFLKQEYHEPNQFQQTLLETQKAISSVQIAVQNIAQNLNDKKNIFFESAQIKMISSELYEKLCRSSLNSLGGNGYKKEFLFEKELRDAIASTIYSGKNEVLKHIIAKSFH